MNPAKARSWPDPHGCKDRQYEHVGLTLQHYVPERKQGGRKGNAASTWEFLQGVADAGLPRAYPGFFRRWKEALTAMGAVWLEATTSTPLAIGLGNASPLEVGLTLHHTYGIPYLPGSALKGLLRRVSARAGLSEQERAVLLGAGPDPLRGLPESAAHLVFWDGLLDPGSHKPLQLDVITPHHPAYYQTRGTTWPTDFDDPVPIPFLSVKPGSTFWVPITYPEGGVGWANLAARLLEWGLTHLGLGAKTHSGYGYFRVRVEEQKTEADFAREVYERLRPFVERINPQDPVRGVRELASKLSPYPPGHRTQTLGAVRERLRQLGLDKKELQEIDRILKPLESGERP